MYDELFVILLTVISGLMWWWAIKVLPRERWQFLATIPWKKENQGVWGGLNLTFYGFFCANALVSGVMILIVLLGTISVSYKDTFYIAIFILALCVPASKIVARLVEKKNNTISVGGAAFVGIMCAPWAIHVLNTTALAGPQENLPVLAVMAAISTAYTFSEGIGRFACISFGCCYGKPLSACPHFIKKLFKNRNFVFTGHTKKIAYAHGFEGQEVLPIQSITSAVYLVSGLFSLYLFLKGCFAASFMETMVITYLWRFASEFFRADFRGDHSFCSVYQIMAIVSVCYAIVILLLFPIPSHVTNPDLLEGLIRLWNPLTILVLQLIWGSIFLFTGKSVVTGASISFFIRHDKI